MRTSEEMTTEFHQALGHPIADKLDNLDAKRLLLRLRLIAEETTELLCAMTGQDDRQRDRYEKRMMAMVMEMYATRSEYVDFVEIADGACDSHVVISGTMIEYGIPEDIVYEIVHAANMAKQGGTTDSFGKSQKPEGWEPPNKKIAEVLGLGL